MNSAHFRLSGTLVMKPAYYTVTGDGVLQRVPREALQLNFRAQTFSSAGVLKITEVIIGGKLYTRVGAGKWTTRLTSESPTTPTSYVGEETISGTAVWHARSAAASHNAYDIWIRESDGYVVKLSYTGTSGTFTMTFDSYNKSPVITHP
jgi:hypothetical protein